MGACTGCRVELRLPNRPEFVAVARLAVVAMAARMQFTVDIIEDIELAVAEAITNAVEHGCPSTQGTDVVSVLCDVEEDKLAITVHDPGNGFDPDTVARQRQADAETPAEGGWGLFLIESLMDEVEYSIIPGDGTRVRMVKYVRAMVVEGR